MTILLTYSYLSFQTERERALSFFPAHPPPRMSCCICSSSPPLSQRTTWLLSYILGPRVSAQQRSLPWEAGLVKTCVNPGSGLGCLDKYSFFCILEVWYRRARSGVLGLHGCTPLATHILLFGRHDQNRANIGPSKCSDSLV